MNYQRILSYLYDYDRGVKRKNIGFVKVETRGDLCRVNIHMKSQGYLPSERLRAYFFFRRNDEILGIPFAEAKTAGNECDVRAMLPVSFFDACGYAPDEFAGVYICGDDRRELVFVSAWDDEPVYVETFRELKPAEPKNTAETSGSVSPAVHAETSKEKKTEIPEEAVKQAPPAEAVEKSEREAEEQNTGMPDRTPWEKLAGNFTKFLAFDGDAAVECLKIRPHHIALLPRQYWNDTNCSFLLHGYYTYGHIILARRETEEAYFLGIPGKNCDRDRVMAGYYGYTKYLPAGRKNRSLGYWCREITVSEK